MTYFLRSGNTFNVAPESAIDIHTKLPVGTYIIKKEPRSEVLYFELVDSFTNTGKVYGDVLRMVDRIMQTFQERTTSTGVGLVGEKGSGKTMLARLLAIECAKLDMPTIIVNAPWKGDDFNKLIQDLQQPCCILFDEFEKVYDYSDQPAILTLLDGVFPQKKLFILTCNDTHRIDAHLRNRPGRIYYMLDFEGLEESFIKEYCGERLNNQSHTDSIVKIAALFSEFNFDMLKAMVEEMNRYNESPQDVLKMLNAKPTSDTSGKYNIELKVDGKVIDSGNIYPKIWNGNPLANDRFTINHDDDGDNDESSDVDYDFTYSDLINVDPIAETFTFKNGNVEVMFTRIRTGKLSFELF